MDENSLCAELEAQAAQAWGQFLATDIGINFQLALQFGWTNDIWMKPSDADDWPCSINLGIRKLSGTSFNIIAVTENERSGFSIKLSIRGMIDGSHHLVWRFDGFGAGSDPQTSLQTVRETITLLQEKWRFTKISFGAASRPSRTAAQA